MMSPAPDPAPDPPRLVDLGITWLDQYRRDLGLDGPEPAMDRLEGYLGATRLAFLRVRGDGPRPLDDQLTRLEAEFCGRLILGPEDWQRFEAEPADRALTWGVMVVEGACEAGSLESLFERGVRVWRESDGSVLQRLETIAASSAGPRPAMDLAGMDRKAMGAALGWFEAAPRRVLPLFVGGVEAADPSHLERLRALGGTIALRVGDHKSADALAQSIERLAAISGKGPGADPFAGLGLATNFLQDGSIATELAPADRLIEWARARFGPGAGWLVHETGLDLIREMVTR
jgi:hypothetical protein